MTYRLRCYTLFDITPTGVTNRRKPAIIDNEVSWEEQRNTQCNYDTIIQVLSLRSQPENISHVEKKEITDQKFGFLYDDEKPQQYWTFEFTIPHKSVFDDGYNDLGLLYYDCEEVPMIKSKLTWEKLPAFLDTNPELCNIYFEVISDE